jgi:hypothetical protein
MLNLYPFVPSVGRNLLTYMPTMTQDILDIIPSVTLISKHISNEAKNLAACIVNLKL